MSATEDEVRGLDAGWETDEPAEDEVDQAWDSLPPPVSAVNASAPSVAPVTEEVDSGWDDVPEGAPAPLGGTGKRRPHRQRRAKTNAPSLSANPVLQPRPAEPSKKHQREHARKQRAYEAQVKQQRKVEKKAQRLLEAREEAAARLRQTEAEEQARRLRREARERAEGERPKPKARPKRTPSAEPSGKAHVRVGEAKREESPAHISPPKRALRPGVIIALLALAAVVALLLVLRK
jgi:hypothetical protein